MAKKNIIAFQGTYGAHGDMACRKAYPYYETKAYPTFEDAMKAVEKGEAELCMIPIENSKAGRVAEIHNLLPDTKLYIVGEYFQRIHHNLVGIKGTKISDVKTVYSHPQALMQCREYINKKKFNREAATNTAIAAEEVAAWKDKSKAAISSELAAEINGLAIIDKHIEDADDNTTVFVAMAREPIDPDPKKGSVITSLLFTARNIPAALYKALGGFATNHVNLLKIESYIPAGKSKTAHFFVSFEGHPDEKNIQLAMEELGFFCKKVKVLGVYYADGEGR